MGEMEEMSRSVPAPLKEPDSGEVSLLTFTLTFRGECRLLN